MDSLWGSSPGKTSFVKTFFFVTPSFIFFTEYLWKELRFFLVIIMSMTLCSSSRTFRGFPWKMFPLCPTCEVSSLWGKEDDRPWPTAQETWSSSFTRNKWDINLEKILIARTTKIVVKQVTKDFLKRKLKCQDISILRNDFAKKLISAAAVHEQRSPALSGRNVGGWSCNYKPFNLSDAKLLIFIWLNLFLWEEEEISFRFFPWLTKATY